MTGAARNAWTGVAALLAVGVAAFLFAAAARAQRSEDDPFYKGLQERGLQSLMRAYLETKGVSGEAESGAAKEVQAAAEAQKAAAAKSVEERDACFERARSLYEQAIAETQKTLDQTPAAQWKPRADLRLQILRWRSAVGKMVFQDWLKNDLQILEVTDRRVGNREEAARLLRVAMEQFRAALRGGTEWLSEIDRDADPTKYRNAGYTRHLGDLRREAEYYTAWTMYCLAWILPKDYKPAEGERSRSDLVNDAITILQGYQNLPDRVAAKWYAYLVVGQAQRELGKYEDALTSLAYADNAAAPEDVKIQAAFERALTRVRQGEYKKARDAIQTAREFFGAQKLDQNLYGLALPLVEAESYLLEGQAKQDAALKDKALALFAEVNQRPHPWPAIVQGLMADLVGAPTNVEDMEPFPLWLLATNTYEKARESQDPKQLEYALRLFKVYAEKVGPQHENHPAALYSQAACLLQLGRKAEAAETFKSIAEGFPKYRYAPDAAKYYIGSLGQVYEAAKTEENRGAYEKALEWFVANWLQTDPGQRYFYALILYRGAKYEEAADQFAKVPQDSEYYPDARYWVALSRLEDFREKVLPTGVKGQILSRARVVSQDLLDFADYARQAQGLPDAKRQELLNWAQAAYLNAAGIYMYPEVGLYADGLQLLEKMETTFQLDKEMQGRLLKYKIEALRRLGRLDEAKAVLNTFLGQAKPEEVGPVLRSLFQAWIEDVQRLIKAGDKDTARAKVKDAEELGDRLREWLQTTGVENRQAETENIQYDLAELHLAVGDYDVAKRNYEEIGGTKPEEAAPIKVDCVYGLARCYEALGEAAPDNAQGAPHFERALELWRALLDLEGQNKKSDPQRIWNYRYHVFFCRYRLGEREEIREALDAQEILSRPEPLGGADPELQQKFRQLRAWVATQTAPK